MRGRYAKSKSDKRVRILEEFMIPAIQFDEAVMFVENVGRRLSIIMTIVIVESNHRNLLQRDTIHCYPTKRDFICLVSASPVLYFFILSCFIQFVHVVQCDSIIV
jgi:hypothetical protein